MSKRNQGDIKSILILDLANLLRKKYWKFALLHQMNPFKLFCQVIVIIFDDFSIRWCYGIVTFVHQGCFCSLQFTILYSVKIFKIFASLWQTWHLSAQWFKTAQTNNNERKYLWQVLIYKWFSLLQELNCTPFIVCIVL